MSEMHNLYDQARMAEENVRLTRGQQPPKPKAYLHAGIPDKLAPDLRMHELRDPYSDSKMYEFTGDRCSWMDRFKSSGKQAGIWRSYSESDKEFRTRVKRKEKFQRAQMLVASGKLAPSLLEEFLNGD